jgi:hypothetical protein
MLERLESWHGEMDVPDDGELDDDVGGDGTNWN